jgi:hypothetical protein
LLFILNKEDREELYNSGRNFVTGRRQVEFIAKIQFRNCILSCTECIIVKKERKLYKHANEKCVGFIKLEKEKRSFSMKK